MQAASSDSVPPLLLSAQGGSAGLGDFWNIVEQAGALRWPIFAVLAVGLVLVIGKLYDLLRDRSLSRALEVDVATAGLEDIRRRVAAQRDSMLASLQSAMLNVFATRPTDGMLHDEIANFVTFQQAQFDVFRRRMDFLSDTAGALGLLGTVWGMFTVFFQGTSDKDVILRGMGIALITTLLGLVVSIILNLAATELSTFFGKRLEHVSKQADRLRFRLLELAMAPGANVVPAAPARRQPTPAVTSPPTDATAPSPREAIDTRASTALPPVWHDLEAGPAEYVAQAGETRRELALTLRRNGGVPAPGVPVAIAVRPGGGTLDGGQPTLRRETDRQGRLQFAWNAPEQAGHFVIVASVVGQSGSERQIHVRVEPGPAHRTECDGNHQAAIAGMRLPHPLRISVYDRFGNRVPGIPVTFSVKSGSGRFGRHGREVQVQTQADGSASTAFAVSDVPGPNVVHATIAGQPPLEFVAFGTEV